MKIVQFVEAFGGGVYTYVKDLCNFIIENDTTNSLEVYLIYSPNRDEFNKNLFLEEINPKVKLHEIEMVRDINLSIDFNVIKTTRNLLLQIRPDVLHIHSAKATVLGRIAAKNIVSPDKIFYSPHGYSFVQQNISKSKKIIFQLIEKLMPIIFGGTTIASGDTEFEISKKYGKTILIRNGVDFTLPDSISSTPKNEKLTIGTVGRLSVQKNPSFFNQLALALPQYNFIWIGNGDLIHEITAPNIQVTGWIKSREDLLKKINQFDIYTQVSLWEGLPISLLEAMAVKKPLLVSNIVGNKDTVINNENGFIYNNLEEAINYIKTLDNTELRNQFREKSYQICDIKFNQKKNLTSLINLYIS